MSMKEVSGIRLELPDHCIKNHKYPNPRIYDNKIEFLCTECGFGERFFIYSSIIARHSKENGWVF
jgi:hypothetical protein